MRLLELIEDLPDPRMQGKVQHNFRAIVFVTMCGILSGCESWVDIADYCEAKLEWLSQFVCPVVFRRNGPSGVSLQ